MPGDDDIDGQLSEEVERAVPDEVLIAAPQRASAGISIVSLSDTFAAGLGAMPDVRIGICCMTKGPVSFERWLTYHAEALRVVKFYLRVEDTPELEALLSAPPWSERCEATYHSGMVLSLIHI